MSKSEFTQWWYFAKIQGMRARQRKLSIAEKKLPPRQIFISWTKCLNRNKCKIELIYKGERNPSDMKTNTQWYYFITWQKIKLLRWLDTLDIWRKCETRLLDKMNAHSFNRDETPDVLWKKVVTRQRWKAHQRLKKEVVRVRTPTESFDQV
ncbi:MAG: hypothetical protein ACRCUT_07450, partial [Spirochaetota bacterium]